MLDKGMVGGGDEHGDRQEFSAKGEKWGNGKNLLSMIFFKQSKGPLTMKHLDCEDGVISE